MAPDDSDTSRKGTNAKLRDERERTDDELVKRSKGVRETADDVVERARQRARAVLALARQREDHAMDVTSADQTAKDLVATAREIADCVTVAEYADADALVFDERSKERRAILGLLALERDDTDQMLAAERTTADARVAARDDMLGLVSHDLRSHLSALLMRTAVMIEKRSNDVELVASADAMQRTIAQMDKLLSDLLDVATIEAGRVRVDRRRTDLVSVVADEVGTHTPAADARSIRLVFEFRTRPIMVDVDPARMSRVVMNLLTNAIKFSPVGGRIDVIVERRENEACISVKDAGPGIAPDKIESVFERFAQIGEQRRGYGLGLFIARRIVDAHRGRIWVDSTPGQGSTFRVALPVAEATTSQ